MNAINHTKFTNTIDMQMNYYKLGHLAIQFTPQIDATRLICLEIVTLFKGSGTFRIRLLVSRLRRFVYLVRNGVDRRTELMHVTM